MGFAPRAVKSSPVLFYWPLDGARSRCDLQEAPAEEEAPEEEAPAEEEVEEEANAPEEESEPKPPPAADWGDDVDPWADQES